MNKFFKFFTLILPLIALNNIISVEPTGDNMLDIKNNLEEISERMYKLEEKLETITATLKTIKNNSKNICEKLDID